VISGDALREFIPRQRWFGSKTRDIAVVHVLEHAALRSGVEPELDLVLVEVRYPEGTHELYQLLVGRRDYWEDSIEDGRYEALQDPALARELVHLIRAGAPVQAEEGTVEFHAVAGFADLGRELSEARVIDSEQSNSSIVFDNQLILKAYRRLEAGTNPELEMLRFLTERGFAHIAPLGGWYAYVGKPLDATLGILQRFVPDGRDGWDLALDELAERPHALLPRLRRLGEVTGELHSVLGSDRTDPGFAPEEPSVEALALLTATIDEEIDRVFLGLPADNEALTPILGRGEEVRDRLRLLTHLGGIGRIIRHHGDYHLGQTLWAAGDWVLLDFEGEPARPLGERRRKRSPLRDVAGMLRSFAYAASASELVRGVAPPPGWEEQARTEFVDAYLGAADPTLLPAGRETFDRLLSVFELEKAVYELRYELNSRPDWVQIPVAGIVRLLESEGA
jgi:predicted trehalose synthase